MSSTRISLRRLGYAESRQLAEALRRVGILCTTAEELAGLMLALADALERHAPPDNLVEYERALTGNLFVRAAARTFLLEVLDLARRHWSESLLKRRRAMELIAYAWICWRNPTAGHKWLDASKEWHPYAATFGISQIRGALNELAPRMGQVYDRLSRIAHPSIMGVVPGIRSHRVSVQRMYRLDVFDGRAYERPRLLRALRAEWILDTLQGTYALVDGFCRRAFLRRPWTGAARELRASIVRVEWRIRSDTHHYRPDIDRLNAHRQAQRHRIRRGPTPLKPNTREE